MSVLLYDPPKDPNIDWASKNHNDFLTVNIEKDFEHTPVDVLIFASDPQRGRDYEMYLKEEYIPGNAMSNQE